MGQARGAGCADAAALVAAFGGNNTGGEIDIATACRAKGGSGHGDFESETFITHALRADGFDASEDGTGRGTPIIAATLRSGVGNGPGNRSRSGDGKDSAIVPTNTGVRRLTPRECERLMGFEDDFTLITYRGKPAADGPRYKALGNSMCTNVVRWIGERIA